MTDLKKKIEEDKIMSKAENYADCNSLTSSEYLQQKRAYIAGATPYAEKLERAINYLEKARDRFRTAAEDENKSIYQDYANVIDAFLEEMK